MVGSFGLSWAYYQFDEGTNVELPFVVYYYGGDNNFSADDMIYQGIQTLTIELYTEHKDFANEQVIENVLKANKMPYHKDETYISSEKMHMTYYTMEVMINEQQS